jgi:hypothetical protein
VGAYVDFSTERVFPERPAEVRKQFSEPEATARIHEVQAARDIMDRVARVERSDPWSDEARADARRGIAGAIPGLTPAALDLMVRWWTDHNMW